MDPNELLLTAARAVAVFVLMLLVIRTLGKRTVGNFSAFDLLVALMLGEIVDEIIYGDVRFLQGTIAVVTIAAMAHIDALLAYWDHGMQGVLEGKPTVIVRDGKYVREGMRQERMNEKDVLGYLRLEGIRDLRVLKQTWAEPAQKADVVEDEQQARAEVIGKQETPPPDKRTDSPQALDQS